MATKNVAIMKNEPPAPHSPMNDQNIFHTEKWQRFSDWLHCICVVNFDLELGQAMEAIYPPHITLGEQEKSNICYLAFPDSNSGCMGDTQFHVRLRVAPSTENTLLKEQHIRFNSQCIPVQRADSGHYWGFVYFRQIKDNRLPRGYFQKSIVLLTRLPFVNLFSELCALIAPQYFDDGKLVLESACDNICHWRALAAGESMTLHLLGTVFQTVIPKMNSKSNGNAQSNSESTGGAHLLDNSISQLPPQVLSSVHEIDIFRSLFSVLTHIHLLWELVLTGEPKMGIATSLAQTATFSSMANSDFVIISAGVTVFNGESTECTITLTNNSNVPIGFLEESLHSTVESKLQGRILQWSSVELQSKLPILPLQSIDFTVTIYGEADFLGPLTNGIGAVGSSHSSNHNAGSHLPDIHSVSGSNLSVSGQNSLPSRMSSPVNIQRRTELTSSFRSTHSGHSSLATISLGGVGSSTTRHMDVQFRFRYSGGEGFQEGYCRQCAVSFNLEFLPSAQVTNWDVLPAEIPSQFYLVLDVVNLTAQEMSLNYTTNKNILIESKESCRVPVPVERCPLERLLTQNTQTSDAQYSLLSGGTDVDMTERACSEHISDQVNLKWTLTGTETSGVTSLRGISLSATMLGLITVAPLQWDIFVDDHPIPAQLFAWRY